MGLLGKNGRAAESSSPVNGQSHERPQEHPWWRRAPVVIGALVFVASIISGSIVLGRAVERMAPRAELEEASRALEAAMAKARDSSDARLNALEREASGNAATLRAIDGRLISIDRKLDTVLTQRRRNP